MMNRGTLVTKKRHDRFCKKNIREKENPLLDGRLKLINNLLKCHGIYVMLEDWKLTVRFAIFSILLLATYALDVCCFLQMVMERSISVAEYVEVLTFIQTQSVTVYRLSLIVRYRKLFKRVLDYLVVDFPSWINDRTRKCLQEKSKTGMWIFNAHLAQLLTVTSLLVLRPLFSKLPNAVPMRPPLGALPHMPVDQTPFYEITYMYQVWKIAVQISAAFCMNMFFFIASVRVCAQMDCVSIDLEKLNGETGVETANETIREFVDRYNTIKKFIDLLNHLFYVLTAIQPLYTAISIVTSLLVFDGTEQSYSFAGIAVAHVLELFIYCYAGELITEKSVALSDKLFQVEWFNLQNRDKRSVLIAINQCQKPFKIKAGLFGYFSRHMFTMTMRTTYSTWAVAKQLK